MKDECATMFKGWKFNNKVQFPSLILISLLGCVHVNGFPLFFPSMNYYKWKYINKCNTFENRFDFVLIYIKFIRQDIINCMFNIQVSYSCQEFINTNILSLFEFTNFLSLYLDVVISNISLLYYFKGHKIYTPIH